MILFTSLHTCNLTAVVEAASVPPPLSSIRPQTAHRTLRTIHSDHFSQSRFGFTESFLPATRPLRHLSDRHLAGISPLDLYCEDNASCRSYIHLYTHFWSLRLLATRRYHKMPLCLPPIPLPPPPPAPAPQQISEELRLGSDVNPSSRSTSSSQLSDPARSSTFGTDEAASGRAAHLTSASHKENLTEKKARRKPAPEPKYLLRCRYGCDGQSGPFKKITSLRRHMMVVHHIIRKPPYVWHLK